MPNTINVGARSLFVTVTAWVFIVLGLLATVSTLVQHATTVSLLPGLTLASSAQPLPLVTGFLLGYLPWVMGAGLLMSLATLASAVGLLMRLDWARRVLWLQQEVVQSVVASTLTSAAVPAKVLGVFGGFVTAARVMAVLMTLGTCLILALIIRSLMTASVRQEFA
jgi:hypothetical protein